MSQRYIQNQFFLEAFLKNETNLPHSFLLYSDRQNEYDKSNSIISGNRNENNFETDNQNNVTVESNDEQSTTGNNSLEFTENGMDKERQHVHLHVLDLTPYDFSNDTINLLKKGLSFTPAPPPNEAQLRQESSEFTRKLRLKGYFVDKNNEFIPNDIVRSKFTLARRITRIVSNENRHQQRFSELAHFF